MSRQRSTRITVALAAAMAVGLVGCTASGELDVFIRDQTDSDALPASAFPGIGIVATSTRLLWVGDEMTIYAAKGSGDNTGRTCLVMVPEYGGSSAGCGSVLPVTLGVEGEPTYMLSTIDIDAGSDKWTKVADHLYVESPQ
ncbi:hypothetical protein N1027_06415 [Herbiconiux sp. CPCC 205763]|uniref:Lipoprotein n=1 Tax=Herbiconiux aconitum TaxID=2970913 RepID=A0ABT2GSH5_9MICO|nr:hypothetical protein [Herbiconiux aconitum]MCS5717766.1 hypothetical protein [Herbiconiux aconitum]